MNKLISELNLTKGTEVKNYILDQQLGVGTYGEVWKARQKNAIENVIAIKFLKSDRTEDLARFKNESDILKKIDVAIVPKFYNYLEHDGVKFIATEFVSGTEIGDIVDYEGVFTEKKAIDILLQIAEALKSIWNDFNVVHRDIKPENIMIKDSDEPVLMDFGISKILDEDLNQTNNEEIIGTPSFMSPEQLLGDELDFKSDMFSLGATLFYMLSGSNPKSNTSVNEIIRKTICEPYPLLKKYNSDISINLSNLIKKMTSRSKDNRYSSWDKLIEDLINIKNNNEVNINLEESNFIDKRYLEIKEDKPHEISLVAIITLAVIILALIIIMVSL